MKNREEFPVIDRTFELIKWYGQHIMGFPRAHRFTLGQRIETHLYAILEELITARCLRQARSAGETAALPGR